MELRNETYPRLSISFHYSSVLNDYNGQTNENFSVNIKKERIERKYYKNAILLTFKGPLVQFICQRRDVNTITVTILNVAYSVHQRRNDIVCDIKIVCYSLWSK